MPSVGAASVVYRPGHSPTSFRGPFEVSDTIAVLGIWDYNIGNY